MYFDGISIDISDFDLNVDEFKQKIVDDLHALAIDEYQYFKYIKSIWDKQEEQVKKEHEEKEYQIYLQLKAKYEN